ncbi:MAG: sugar phosphate isomerase/epimerase [Planctomycetota bacterium]|nr:sugar phosphate isomerase/epimerase [Planctomycetota bacterium]
MHRRDLLRTVAGGLTASALKSASWGAEPTAVKTTQLGVVIYCCGILQQTRRASGQAGDLADPLTFLEHCRQLGAGGIQTSLGVRDDAYASRLREQAERYQMFVESTLELPRNEADRERFEAEVRTAKRAGADVARVVLLPGRRYERFSSLQEFREFADLGLKSLQLAEPIAARHAVRLAVENHKDHRIQEKLAVLKQLSSEHVGVCVDVGNNLALLEDPQETVTAFAPWACAVHLKDHFVREFENGFLLADAALGDGFLDLPQLVAILRKANPGIHFCLETITRDPLRVPCLTDKYWATFSDLPGRDLARTLRTVRAHTASALLEPSRLSLQEQVTLEQETVRKSLAYAREQLNL